MILELDRIEGLYSVFHDPDGNIYNIKTEKINLALAAGDSVNAEKINGEIAILSKNNSHREALESSIASLLEKIKQNKK